jgi:GST-like protein
MKTLADFPITARWPAVHPDRLQLYSLATPNGQKVTIALEEMGVPYEAHYVDFGTNDQKSEAFLSLNPNGKIPAIIDPNGPGGQPLALFESGAILQYLAEKTGKLISSDPVQRIQTIQWVYFQMGGVGPMFGQMGFFVKFAGKDIEDPRPRQRYVDESKRLLGVIDARLEGRAWMMGDDFTIADAALLGWVNGVVSFYNVGDLVGWGDLKNVPSWLSRGLERPAVARAMNVPVKPTSTNAA